MILHWRDFVLIAKTKPINAALKRGENLTFVIRDNMPRLDKWDRQMLTDQLRLGAKEFRRRLTKGGK